MFGSAKCPKCDAEVLHMEIRGVDATTADMRTYRVATLLCPNCNVILGAAIDPTVVAADVVDRVARLLKRG